MRTYYSPWFINDNYCYQYHYRYYYIQFTGGKIKGQITYIYIQRKPKNKTNGNIFKNYNKRSIIVVPSSGWYTLGRQ